MKIFFFATLLAVLILCVPLRADEVQDSHNRSLAGDGTMTSHYEFSWGTWPNIQTLSINYLSISGLLNDGIWYAIKGSRADGIAMRLLNFFVIQGGVGCYFLGTVEHELGHIGYAIDAGFKPHLAGYSVETIRSEYLTKTTEDNIVMYLGGGMNTDTYTSYETVTAMYSGSKVPCVYGLITTYKKISNFQYVYRNDRYVRNPLSHIREFYKNYDPLIYDVYLTMKYGYYDSVLPVWAYAPCLGKSLFILANPYAYINPFMKDQYRRMKTAYLIELLDPSIIELFWGIRRYLKYGDTVFTPLMIPIRSVKFMPGMRGSLGNYGAENYYDLHFLVQDIFPFTVYYRKGGNKWDTLHGCGVEIRNISMIDRLSMTYQFDYWTIVRGSRVAKNREYLAYNYRPAGGTAGPGLFRRPRSDTHGINVFMKASWEFWPDWFFTGGIGYKSYGALLSKQLDAGLYGYGGIGFNIRYQL